MRVSNDPFLLEAARSEPSIDEREPLAAVVVLQVIEPDATPLLQDRAVLCHTVRHLSQDFG